MKKAVSILLTVAILSGMMSTFCFSASAQGNEFVLDIGEVQIPNWKSSVDVPVNIVKNDGIAFFIMNVQYDTAKLRLWSVESDYLNITSDDRDFGAKLVASPKEFKDCMLSSGTLFTLHFFSDVSAGDMIPLTASFPDEESNIDVDGNLVSVSVYDGELQVEGRVEVITGKADKTSAFPGETVTLTANAAPSGKVFDKWVGDGVVFENMYSPTTTFVMPKQAVSIQATYKNKTYPITVKGGKANIAEATAGQTVIITANTPAKGKVFDKWIYSGTVLSDKTLSVAQFVMPAAPVSFEATYREQPNYGDINGDGEISLKDLLLLRKYLADMIKTIDRAAADVNADGTVNMKDVLMLRMYLAERISVLGV